jgi:hypothetical protein
MEKMWTGNVVNTDQIFIDYGPITTDLTPITVAMRLDFRMNQATSLNLSSGATVTPGFGRTIGLITLGANSNVDYITTDIHEFAVLPGDAVQMRSNTANNSNNFAFMWRERFLEDSERA